jgi:hypothetical protein
LLLKRRFCESEKIKEKGLSEWLEKHGDEE